SDGATHSCAHWLNWKCGIDLGAARERVRVAHALDTLPRIAAAMASGAIDAETAVARWRGDLMDYDLGVDVLLQQARRTRAQGVAVENSQTSADVSAETWR
ncbi:MAG TPA: DUF222 domain-containing protein, partial [Steroidobacteraceae bacterium]